MIMKNIKYILITVLAAFFVTSCDWFVLDNADQHDAKIYGKILDKETNKLIPSDVGGNTGTGIMKITETGWDSEVPQTWYVKNNGTYRNN